MPSDHKEETREPPSDPDEEAREAPSSPEGETKAPSDHEEETKDAAGPTDLEGLVVPACRKLTTSGNFPSNSIIAHVEFTGARRHEKSSAAKLFADE